MSFKGVDDRSPPQINVAWYKGDKNLMRLFQADIAQKVLKGEAEEQERLYRQEMLSDSVMVEDTLLPRPCEFDMTGESLSLRNISTLTQAGAVSQTTNVEAAETLLAEVEVPVARHRMVYNAPWRQEVDELRAVAAARNVPCDSRKEAVSSSPQIHDVRNLVLNGGGFRLALLAGQGESGLNIYLFLGSNPKVINNIVSNVE